MSSKLAKNKEPLSYQALSDKNHALEAEIQDLRARLEEAEELKRAISEGDLDALIIPGPEGELIFTLDSADRAYRVLVETMNEGTATLAFDGTILYCNRRFAELMRMPLQAVVGTSIYGLVKPESIATFKALLKNELSMGEISLQAEGDIDVPVYLSINSLKDEGSPNAWCIVVTDLTEQKKNEEIIAADRLTRSIIEQAAEAIVVCDTSGRITHFSNVVPKICKCDPTLQRFEDIIDVRYSEGDDAGKSILPVSSALKGFSIFGAEVTFEFGDCLTSRRKYHLLLNSGPLKNDDGKIRGCVITLADITERKQAEEALRESEKRFKLLSEANSILLLSKEPEDMIQTIAEKVMRHLNCDVFFNYVFDEAQGRLYLNACGGISEEVAKEIKWLDKGGAICGCVARDGYRIISEDVQHNEDRRANLVRSMGIQAYSCQPLCIGEKTVGTLSFGTRSRKSFTGDELALMSTVADQVSVAIERKQAEEALHKAYEQIETQSEELRISNEELKAQSEELKEANEALYKSEKRFRTLAENSPDIIARFDRQKRHTYVNPAVAEPYGRSPEEIIGKTQSELGRYSEQLKFLEKHYENVFATGKPETVEFRYISSQEKEYYLNTKIVPEFVDSKVTSILAISRDITDIKVAEAKLKKTRDNLENLVKERTAELEKAYSSLKESERGLAEAQKMAHIGNWEWDVATDKAYWSEEMYRIFGRNPQELAPSCNEFLNYVHSGDRDYVNSIIKEAKNGKPYIIDFRIISADGIERIVHKQSEVIFNEKGTPVGLRGTVQDITESKLAQQKLQQSEEKYRSFIQNFKGIAFQLDKDFNLEFIHGSVKEITGYAEKELVSGGWKQVILPEDLYLIIKESEKAQFFDDWRGELDYRIRSKDGKIKWVHDIHQKVQRRDREPIYTGIVYDITEKKEAEEALTKMEKIRIKEIHHRIKNNLQVICSLLSLEAEKFNDEKMLEAFRESQNRVASMALIHEELYRGGKSDAINFAAYLYKLTADLFNSYNLRNDNISLKMDLDQVHLGMDTAIPLGIIVNELISNSLKHAFPAGGTGEVHINLCETESLAAKYSISGPCSDYMEDNGFHYMLTVTDDGKGIPEKIDFRTADSLGLQLVNILVEQIDGCIELRRDHGTKFIILFNNIEE